MNKKFLFFGVVILAIVFIFIGLKISVKDPNAPRIIQEVADSLPGIEEPVRIEVDNLYDPDFKGPYAVQTHTFGGEKYALNYVQVRHIGCEWRPIWKPQASTTASISGENVVVKDVTLSPIAKSSSMLPALWGGMRILEKPVKNPELDVKIGDIIVFKDPEGSGTIVHRVGKKVSADGTNYFVTYGDNNCGSELVPYKNVVSIVVGILF